MNEFRCIIIDDEPYAITQLEELISLTPGVVHSKSFDNAYDAMQYLHNHGPVDIIFSDISMPFITGIEAASLLKPYCEFLVFITGHRDYGEESFELDVDGYLMKPLMKVKFIKQIERLRNVRVQNNNPLKDDQFILIKGSLKNKYLSVRFDGITYIKALSNYVQIFSEEGQQTTYLTLSDMEVILKGRSEFLRINRSEIISFNHVKQIDGFQIVQRDGKRFSVSRTYKKTFESFIQKRLPVNSTG